MNKFGFVRVSVCSPTVSVGNPKKNLANICEMINSLPSSDIIVFPELCVTGYSCRDLFRQEQLMIECENEIARWLKELKSHKDSNNIVMIGAPVEVGNARLNCALDVQYGEIIGIIPKQNIPTYGEFEEGRWFRSGAGIRNQEIRYANSSGLIPFGTDLLFRYRDVVIGVEICEDLWMPIPPSSYQALAGATILCNLSASNETVAKADYRIDLVKNQSGRCASAYLYASAGPSESTTDVVFGGHCLIAENGQLLEQTKRVGCVEDPVFLGPSSATSEVDCEMLLSERRFLTSFGDASLLADKKYREIEIYIPATFGPFMRSISATPFVPKDPTTLKNRCAEIFGIQCAGLAGRLKHIGKGRAPDVYIGVSGGKDSTLALLVAVKTYNALGYDLKKIHGITMPGFGTTQGSLGNAKQLMTSLGISQEVIQIRKGCLQDFLDLGHKPFGINIDNLFVDEFQDLLKEIPADKRCDLVFENVQARRRTMMLMSKGFVIGTGSLSELALGWCTFNGDHMSMYSVNASIPKTLGKFLISYVAGLPDTDPVLSECLLEIAGAVISPELLPPDNNGQIQQSSEGILGPYEIIDFILPKFIRNGFSPEKILFLARHAHFSQNYEAKLIVSTMRTFLTKFFSQQFKKNCVPDSSKVGSVSLSPRGDWRMPSDADVSIWLENVRW